MKILTVLSACIQFMFLAVSAFEDFNSTNSNETVKCEREHTYDKLDIRSVTGKWKIVELYTHLILEGIKRYKSCPIITIWESEELPRTTFGVGKTSFRYIKTLKLCFKKLRFYFYASLTKQINASIVLCNLFN